MYPRIPWELIVDPLGSAEHTLGTTALGSYIGVTFLILVQ
jgi:hypothetical protein